MALIICPECGEKVSDKATTCIHCGFPIETLNIKKIVDEKKVKTTITTARKDVKRFKKYTEDYCVAYIYAYYILKLYGINVEKPRFITGSDQNEMVSKRFLKTHYNDILFYIKKEDIALFIELPSNYKHNPRSEKVYISGEAEKYYLILMNSAKSHIRALEHDKEMDERIRQLRQKRRESKYERERKQFMSQFEIDKKENSNQRISGIKCPSCGSTSVSKIGTLNRAASIGMFGLASSKIGKTRECKSCGYKW